METPLLWKSTYQKRASPQKYKMPWNESQVSEVAEDFTLSGMYGFVAIPVLPGVPEKIGPAPRTLPGIRQTLKS